MDVLGMVDKTFAGIKKLREISQKLHDAELQNTIADLLVDVADLKVAVANQREDNAQLRTDLEKLRNQDDLRKKVKYENGMYSLTQPVPGLSMGPFCPRCWEDRGKLMTLQRYCCYVCEASYGPDTGPFQTETL